jgi:tRNA threonylcarbamoyladenosine biosynthesis protein TsaE
MKEMFFEALTTDERETRKLAEIFAKEVLFRFPLKRRAMVLALDGPLGSGKTTFVKGFACGLGLRQKITSPTFLIMRAYRLPKGSQVTFWHIDCYRLHYGREIIKLGFRDVICDPGNIVLIEWAKNIKPALPKKIIQIKFRPGSKENWRIIRIKST